MSHLQHGGHEQGCFYRVAAMESGGWPRSVKCGIAVKCLEGCPEASSLTSPRCSRRHGDDLAGDVVGEDDKAAVLRLDFAEKVFEGLRYHSIAIKRSRGLGGFCGRSSSDGKGWLYAPDYRALSLRW